MAKLSKRNLLDAAKDLYGYPLSAKTDVSKALKSSLADAVGSPEEILEDFAFHNVHIDVEGLQNAVVRDDPEPQPADIFARHMSGLLSVNWSPSFARSALSNNGDFLIDMNPRSDGLTSAVYYQSADEDFHPVRGTLSRFWIFDSVSMMEKAQSDFFALERADLPNLVAERKKLAAAFAVHHPRVSALFAKSLKEFGVPAPNQKAPPEDPGGRRLLSCHDALLPVADVIVARATGKKPAGKLSAADKKRALGLGDLASGYPPSITLVLLTPLAAGDHAASKQAAQAIVARKLGVPLTQRMAQQVLDGVAPLVS